MPSLPVSYTHLRAHETGRNLVCRLLLEKKIEKILTALGDSPYRSAKVCSVMVLCTNTGEIIKNTIGICWGEILKKPAYPNGDFESLFWVRETNCTYGELNNAQLSKHGSRGKAARELAPYLLKAIGIKK